MLKYALTLAVALASSTALAGNAHYPDNAPPLQPTPMTALPLGSVRANGWLLRQLELQRDGLTGRMEVAMEEFRGDASGWLGGAGENWEKGPYYVKGLVPLAYTLGDDALKQRAQKWVDWTLSSQRPDGFYGPKGNDDWWPRMVANYYLRDYHEATGDARVLPFLTNYYRHLLANLPNRPLKEWGKARAGDEMDTVLWLHRRTREPFLLEVVDLLRRQAYDWPEIFRSNGFHGFGLDFHPKHNVNVPQAYKMPAVSWQRTGDARERAALEQGTAHLMRDHGTSLGLWTGTEFLAGRSTTQGIEFCSVVEQMLSDETVVRVTGDAKYADRLERLAYNALPAAWNRDLTALEYYTLPNHVIAIRGRHGFGQDYDNGTLPGPRSGFPCCCFNVHMGWPKLVQNSWAATDDNGLAAVAYAPTTVTAKVADGATATIVEDTTYPFGEEVKFTVTLDREATFPLALRVPAWCNGATVTVNGEPAAVAQRGEFAKLRRAWKSGDVVVLKLPMTVRAEQGVHNSVSLHRGPLVYALRVDENVRKVGEPAPGFPEYELTPNSAWNYALALDPKDAAKSVELLTSDGPPPANPFDKDAAPVKLKAKAKRLPAWTLDWTGRHAFDPPSSPVASDEAEETVTFLPFGAQDLRLTDLPYLGEPAGLARKAYAFDFNRDAAGWVWYGGGWQARDGALRSHPNGGWPGFKALVENAEFADVVVEADVTVPEAGDAGVVARVRKPALGADAFEGYYAGVRPDLGLVVLGKANGLPDDKGWHPLGEAKVEGGLKPGATVRLSLTAKGDKLEVRLGGKLVVEATDASYPAGAVGVRTWCGDSDKSFGAFDNFKAMPAGAPNTVARRAPRRN